MVDLLRNPSGYLVKTPSNELSACNEDCPVPSTYQSAWETMVPQIADINALMGSLSLCCPNVFDNSPPCSWVDNGGTAWDGQMGNVYLGSAPGFIAWYPTPPPSGPDPVWEAGGDTADLAMFNTLLYWDAGNSKWYLYIDAMLNEPGNPSPIAIVIGAYEKACGSTPAGVYTRYSGTDCGADNGPDTIEVTI